MTYFNARNKRKNTWRHSRRRSPRWPASGVKLISLAPPLLSPGRDGGTEVRDAGDEGHVHGGRRLPAARATAAAGAGGSSGGRGAAVTTP